MAFANGGSIVTSGLVLALDAGDRNSYPGSGSSTWVDLSGNSSNGTLTNGPTFSSANGGSIVFDGTNDFANLALNTGSFTTEATLMMYLKLVNATPLTTSETGIERLSANVIKPASHYPWIDGVAYFGTFQSGSARIGNIVLSSTVDRTNWHMITITSSPGANNWRFYQNTQLVKTGLGSDTIFFSPDGVYNIGRSQINTNSTLFYCRGSIATTLLYNRALSASEIQQNYNAQKSRFGL